MALEALFQHLPEDERHAALTLLRVQIARRRRLSAVAVTRTEKRCPRCEQTKPVSEFGLNRARPDGLQSLCKACR